MRERGVLVAVADIRSGTWQIARDMFEVLQRELDLIKKNGDEVKINIEIIQEVSNDITALIKFTINTKEITEAVNLYKNKLRSAIG